jgi:3'(2'), 5'-bisphosphate nucleotidase
MEASHGDREVTEGVFKRLGLTRDYLRLDGQCKYCVVGSGAAEGNMRLPPMGYREKIWDHAPGVHFITEAGGTVTDLSGEELDFGQGRLLPECVNGILASNNLLHTQILEAVTHERELKKRNQQHPSRRIFLD